MALLSIYRDGLLERTVELSSVREWRIGRADQNDIVLNDNIQSVSRFHAEIKWDHGKPVIVDLNSQNGIQLKGVSKRRVSLDPGVGVTIGPFVLMIGSAAGSMDHPSDASTRVGSAGRTPQTGRVPASRWRAPAWVGGLLVLAAVIGLVAHARLSAPEAPDRVEVTSVPAPSPAPAPTPVEPRLVTAGEPAPRPVPTVTPPVDDPAPVVPPVPETRPAPKRGPAPETVSAAVLPRPADPVAEERADRYARARAAYDRQAFVEATALLRDLLRDAPDFFEAQRLVVTVRDAQRAAVRAKLDAAAGAEAAAEWPAAIRHYEQVTEIDPSMSGLVVEALTRIRDRMRRDGTAAFADAAQHDSAGRINDALRLYQRAYDLLPEDDSKRQVAKQRLDVLRRGGGSGQ